MRSYRHPLIHLDPAWLALAVAAILALIAVDVFVLSDVFRLRMFSGQRDGDQSVTLGLSESGEPTRDSK
jgi:hypothetical protein